MIIEVVGTQYVSYTKDGRQITGYNVHAVVIEDDYIVPDLNGSTVFTGYFSGSTLRLTPQLGAQYRVLKQRVKIDGHDVDRYVDLVEA